jgi:hypothetical protein
MPHDCFWTSSAQSARSCNPRARWQIISEHCVPYGRLHTDARRVLHVNHNQRSSRHVQRDRFGLGIENECRVRGRAPGFRAPAGGVIAIRGTVARPARTTRRRCSLTTDSMEVLRERLSGACGDRPLSTTWLGPLLRPVVVLAMHSLRDTLLHSWSRWQMCFLASGKPPFATDGLGSSGPPSVGR